MALSSGNEAQVDVAVCALAAMGLSDDPGFLRDLTRLLETGRVYGQRKLSDLALSYAASAVGKLAESCPSDRLAGLVDVLRKSVISGGTHTARSSVIALGSVGARRDLAVLVVQDVFDEQAAVVDRAARGEREPFYAALLAGPGPGRPGPGQTRACRKKAIPMEQLHASGCTLAWQAVPRRAAG